jgi:hypothetical protein
MVPEVVGVINPSVVHQGPLLTSMDQVASHSYMSSMQTLKTPQGRVGWGGFGSLKVVY